MPISWMSVTYDADLEPRPLPSAGVTRLRRYYGPLRHPKRPSLSLTGVRLRVTPLTAWASRVAFDLHLPTCRRHYPGGPLGLDRSWDGLFQLFPCTQRLRPSPSLCKVGDHIGLFEACSTFTGYYGLSARRSPIATHLSRRLRRFRFLHRRSDSYRLERPSCRVGFTPTEDQHLTRFTAHAMSVRLNVDKADLPYHPDRELITSRLRVMGEHQLQLTDADGTVLAHSISSGWSAGQSPTIYHWYMGTFPKGRATQLRYFSMLRVRSEAPFDFANIPLP